MKMFFEAWQKFKGFTTLSKCYNADFIGKTGLWRAPEKY